MSAETGAPTRDERQAAQALAGLGTMMRFLLRRDRVKLPAWTGGLGLFVAYVALALPSIAGTEEELASATQLFADPVGRLLIGPGYGFDEPSIERFVANGYGLYFGLTAALMSILLVVRHTRLEEQTGRAELVRANVLGRSTPLTAALVVALITNAVGAFVVAASMIGIGGFDPTGSLVFGVGVGATGLAFAGITAVTVQLSEYSRGAAGMAGAVLGAAFLIRAGGDMATEGGTALSWVSPLAWAQQTAPFVLNRWWPLLLNLGLLAVCTVLSYLLANRRDLGASLVATRAGAGEGSASLGTPLGLALRLQRGNAIGWMVALAVSGMAFGAYADALLDAFADLPEVFTELFGAEDMVNGYLGYMAVFMAFLAGAYAMTAVQGLRGEETSGRLEPVLSTPIGRWRWLTSNLAVSAGAVVVIMVAAGAGSGVGAALVTGDWSYVWSLTWAHLNHVPAAWVVLGVAWLLLGVAPRAVPVAWALVGFGLVAGTFGPLLDLPDLILELSPFAHAAEVPAEEFRAAPLVVLTALAGIAAITGCAAYRRRDLDLT